MEAGNRSRLTLLHLSGLKFAGGAASERQADALVQDLGREVSLSAREHRPEALIVSGDLTQAGKPSEFAVARRFLAGLASSLSIPRSAIVVVPGNHDINRKSCEAYFNQCEAEERTPEPPYFPKLEHFAAFFAQLHEPSAGPQFGRSAPYSFFELPEPHCVIAALNSTMADTHRPEDHGGFLGEAQLRYFAGQLRSYHERGFLRLAVLHHDPAGSGSRGLRDVELLRSLLGPSLHLLLCGQPGPAAFDALLPGVLTCRPAGSGIGVQLLQLSLDAVRIWSREPRPDRARSDESSSLAGDPAWTAVAWQPVAAALAFSLRAAKEAEGDATLARTVSAYRARMVEYWQRQTFEELATRGDDRQLPQGLALLDIYVPQHIAPRLPLCDLPGSALSDAAPLSAILAGEEGSARASSVPTVESLLQAGDFTLLMGSPGAGKSTLIRWLCLKLCLPGETLPEVPIELVPVRIEARDFSAYLSGLAAPAAPPPAEALDPALGRSAAVLLAYLDRAHPQRLLPLYGAPLRELYRRGRLLLLFDGLDEISDPELRLRCVELLCELAEPGEAGPRVRILITSRIVGVDRVLSRLSRAGVATFTLQDFSPDQITQFVRTWYARTGELLGRPQEAEAYAQRLLRLVAENKALAELCARPLLLTLLVLLGRSGELPRTRHHLYGRAVELLAEEWHPTPHGDLGLDRLGKLAFLRELAGHMVLHPGPHENAIEEAALRQFTADFLRLRDPALFDLVESRIDGLIQQLREKNQVLADVGGHRYGFVHRAFLDYLAADRLRTAFAAHYLSLEQLEDIFSASWAGEARQEPLILLCGMLGEDRPELIARALQRIATEKGLIAYSDLNFLLFALNCFGELPSRYDAHTSASVARFISLLMSELSGKDRVFWRSADDLISAFMRFSGRWFSESEWVRWTEFAKSQINPTQDGLHYGALPFFAISCIANPFLTQDERLKLGCAFLSQADRYEDVLNIIESMGMYGVAWERLFDMSSPLPLFARLLFVAHLGDLALRQIDILRRIHELAQQEPADPRIAALVQFAEIKYGPRDSNYEEKLLKYYHDHKTNNANLLVGHELFTNGAKRKQILSFMGNQLTLPEPELDSQLRNPSISGEVAKFIITMKEKPLHRYVFFRQIQTQLEEVSTSSPHEPSRLLAWELEADAYGASRLAYRELRRLAETAREEEVRRRARAALASLQQLYGFSRVGKPARRRAEVRLSGEPVGLLEETETGTQFLYDPSYAQQADATPISPTLPLSGGRFASRGLLPFFDNLLPEGWLLDLASQQHHLDRSDGMGLLLHTGRDCIGAIEVIALTEDGP